MEQDAWIIVVRRPVKREGSVQYMVIVLVSFAISVSLTRLFLSLSGYPQIGSSELHLAHVLWGGLLLFVAALVPLLISNRRAYRAAAILAGIGVGLFIDEVGKFITQRNDYFYPAAAPIIYVFFMLTLLLLLQLRRREKVTARAELSRALETLQDWIYFPLSQPEQRVLLGRLEAVARDSSSSILASLASGILSVVQRDERRPPVEQPPPWAVYVQGLQRWVSEPGLRLGLAVGFALMALVAFKNPADVLIGSRLPPAINEWLFGFHSGRWVGGETAAMLYRVRLVMETILGLALAAVSWLLLRKRPETAVPLGYVALLVYLGAIDLFLFYFEQFSTILLLLYQALLLLGLLYYRKRFPAGATVQPETVSAPA